MPIKIELSDIPTIDAAALTDYALVSYGYNGAARRLALDAITGAGPVFTADDGNQYRLTGYIVDGQLILGGESV